MLRFGRTGTVFTNPRGRLFLAFCIKFVIYGADALKKGTTENKIRLNVVLCKHRL